MTERRKRFWLLHYGTKSMGYYAIFRHEPLVSKRIVKDAKTGENVPLYEANGFVFNFCETGIERWIRMAVPLGQFIKLKIEVVN